MKKTRKEATSLRSMMFFAVFMIIGLSIVGFYYAQEWFSEIAKEISVISAAKPTAGNIDTQDLLRLQQNIDSLQTVTNKANDIIVSSQYYQDSITKDLDKYASDNSISISGYDFTKQDMINATSPISGIKPNFVTITFSRSIPFTNLMNFLKEVETNSPKMQLTGINISSTSNSGNDITVGPLTIEVYTK